MTIDQIAGKIRESGVAEEHKPVMIAVEGFGGSGKSTFAANLRDALSDAYVVPIDDFYIKEKAPDAIKSNFDRARLERQVLKPIRNGQPAIYERLIWDTNSFSEPITVPDVSYVIVEGVSSYDPAIADYYDFKIWVETPKSIAKQRGSHRDKSFGTDNDDLWEDWIRTYQEYKDLNHPDQAADFIFDNSKVSKI